MAINPENLNVVLATDCGSTTTKAVMFEKTAHGWRQTFRGEAPTTVEKPIADVTIGVRNSFLEVQELSGRQILKDTEIPILHRNEQNITGQNGAERNGIDLYVSTSSAGGGLQMVVAGVVDSISAASAQRAALGAGAIVMDSFAADDGRESFERVQKIRHLRPDIVLLSGGTEGGNKELLLEMAETILQADPRPRFGETLTLPIIFAGNSEAAESVNELLGKKFQFVQVPNLRPELNCEKLEQARDAVHDLFLEHVMSHAPGYSKLLTWSPAPILPTPGAVGDMVLAAAKKWNIEILAVDIGGATTDVFSVFKQDQNPIFNRTVSANLGMSYSIANVLLEAGESNILRWLPFELSANELRDRLRNKMIRPTSIPYLVDDLVIEQAVCREALRLAFEHHKRLATGIIDAKRKISIGDIFRQGVNTTLVDVMNLDLIIGSGGVISHAPTRASAAFMLLDSYQPEGVTRLAVDSIFMMPHLGVFASVHPKAAEEIFIKDCLVSLGSCVAPIGRIIKGEVLATVELGNGKTEKIIGGELKIVQIPQDTEMKITPNNRFIDVGAGAGKVLESKAVVGEVGLILDGRGRPIIFEKDDFARIKQMQSWYRSFDLAWD
jgi:uncharacterized protein (TIGR01319 family)